MLVTMKEMLETARKEKYAVGGFEFWSLDSAYAVIEAANSFKTPVILQVGGYESSYMGGYANSRKIAEIAAEEAQFGVALHFDHAEEYDEICRALDAGLTSVMIDASKLPLNENISITQKVVETAKKYGASVEAELGKIGGNEGNIAVSSSEETDAEEAAMFVRETGIDALAVAIGTAHGFYKSTPRINIERLKEIAAVVEIPLVLHGGSGTPEDKITESIANGIAKINICTEFIAAFGKGYIQAQNMQGFSYNVPSFFKYAKENARSLVEEKMKLFLGII